MADSTPDVGGLLARIKDKDTDALAALFSLHRERLGRGIRFRLDPRLQRRVGVDDVLQEVYLNAAQRIAAFDGKSEQSFFIWLRLVAGQTMIDIHRRHIGAQARDAGREVPVGGGFGPQATSASFVAQLVGDYTSPSQAAIREEMATQIEQAVGSLEPIDREILALRHFEELTNSEVAEVLGIQQKAASIRYVRALGRLKQVLVALSDFRSRDGGALEKKNGND